MISTIIWFEKLFSELMKNRLPPAESFSSAATCASATSRTSAHRKTPLCGSLSLNFPRIKFNVLYHSFSLPPCLAVRPGRPYLVTRIQTIQTRNIRFRRSNYEGWVDCCNTEVRFLLLNEIPCCLFRELFRNAVPTDGVTEAFLSEDGAPVVFAVDFPGVISPGGIGNGGEGGCNNLLHQCIRFHSSLPLFSETLNTYDSLHLRRIFFRRL